METLRAHKGKVIVIQNNVKELRPYEVLQFYPFSKEVYNKFAGNIKYLEQEYEADMTNSLVNWLRLGNVMLSDCFPHLTHKL